MTLAVANFAKLMLLDRVGLMVSLVVCATLAVVVAIAKINNKYCGGTFVYHRDIT